MASSHAKRLAPLLSEDRQENGETPFLQAWCHGAPGIGLRRIATRRVLTDMDLEAEIRAALASSREAGQEIPGLMTGLAGIGYGLLRTADPERVPSVLLLDLPE